MPFRIIHDDNKTRAYSDDVLMMPEVLVDFYGAFWEFMPSPDGFEIGVHHRMSFKGKGEPLFSFDLEKFRLFRSIKIITSVAAPVDGLYLAAQMFAKDLSDGPFIDEQDNRSGVMILLKMGHSVSANNYKFLMQSMYGHFCSTIMKNAKHLYPDRPIEYVEKLIEQQLSAKPKIVNLWKDTSWAESFKRRMIDNTIVLD